MANNSYTKVPEAGVFVCDDCGAHAEDPREVKHFDTCVPGESERWAKSYAEPVYIGPCALCGCDVNSDNYGHIDDHHQLCKECHGKEREA